MRKRLGILLLIFSLLLFFPTQKTYGQEAGFNLTPEAGIIGGLLLILPIWAISSYFSEDKKCNTIWHAGDYFYEKNYILIKPINIKVQKCHNKCIQKSMNQNVGMGSLRNYKKDETGNFNECFNPCFKETLKTFPTSIATCKYEGVKGHYSDGSYYYSSGISHQLLLKNRHKLKDKYEKTEWQKARDECMELTSKKRIKWLERPMQHNERLLGSYNDCLKERGY